MKGLSSRFYSRVAGAKSERQRKPLNNARMGNGHRKYHFQKKIAILKK